MEFGKALYKSKKTKISRYIVYISCVESVGGMNTTRNMEQKNRTSDFSKQMGKKSPKKNQISERAAFPKKMGKKSNDERATFPEKGKFSDKSEIYR